MVTVNTEGVACEVCCSLNFARLSFPRFCNSHARPSDREARRCVDSGILEESSFYGLARKRKKEERKVALPVCLHRIYIRLTARSIMYSARK